MKKVYKIKRDSLVIGNYTDYQRLDGTLESGKENRDKAFDAFVLPYSSNCIKSDDNE